MMEVSVQMLIAVSAIILLFVFYTQTKSHKKALPSLPWLPIVGSLPFLSDIATLHLCLTEKAKRYGNIYSLYAARRYSLHNLV